MIVVVIIGILASVAIPSYSRIVERSRGAEARQVLGYLRSRAIELHNEDPAGSVTEAELNIDQGGSFVEGEVPGTTQGCKTSHFFSYSVTASTASAITIRADRCTSGGKTPDSTAGKYISITVSYVTGGATWSTNTY
ncbi:MAG: hypothetical protein HZC15_01705 [Candidatus Omnitrophica bacterium]|nr:hypothetical protein [Candidatus Omnitrophota bacterium]